MIDEVKCLIMQLDCFTSTTLLDNQELRRQRL
jgi:hypothetical protein